MFNSKSKLIHLNVSLLLIDSKLQLTSTLNLILEVLVSSQLGKVVVSGDDSALLSRMTQIATLITATQTLLCRVPRCVS